MQELPWLAIRECWETALWGSLPHTNTIVHTHTTSHTHTTQENAYEQEQKYKIGKVILEKAHMIKDSSWQ